LSCFQFCRGGGGAGKLLLKVLLRLMLVLMMLLQLRLGLLHWGEKS